MSPVLEKMRPVPKIRMQDVAEHVGVSVSTVSRVLSGNCLVSNKVKRLIDEAVLELGYRRIRRHIPKMNSALHFDRTSELTGSIGLLAPRSICESATSEIHHYNILFASLLSEVEKYGFRLVTTACDPANCEEILSVVEDQNLDGLVVAFSPSSQSIGWLKELAGEIPVVAMNTVIPYPSISSISVDNRLLMYKAVSRLLELGHQRIAYFGIGENHPSIDPIKDFHALERRRYFIEAMCFSGIGVDRDLCMPEIFGKDEHSTAIAAAMERVMSLESKPTAVLSALGYMPCFIHEATRMGLAIGRDLSLLATDESPFAAIMPCPLTTISSNHTEGARLVMRVLLGKIRNREERNEAFRIIRYEPLLVERQSLGHCN